MKRILPFLSCLFLLVAAKSQSNYTDAIQLGDNAFKKGEYKKAINYYFAAQAFDPSKKETVKAKVNMAFDAIDDLRKKANEETKKAQANYLISEAKSVASNDPTLALRLAEQAMRYYNSKAIEQAALNIYMDKGSFFYKIIGHHEINMKSCIVSSDKKSFLSRDSSGIHIIDLATKKEKTTISVSNDAGVVFSGDGSFLVTTKVRNKYSHSIFDKDNHKLGEFTTDTNYLIKFSLKGDRLITYNNHGQFKFFDFNGNVQKVANLTSITDCDFAVSEDESFILTYNNIASTIIPGKTDWEYDVILWNDRGELVSVLKDKITKPFNFAIFTPDRSILLANDDNTVTFIDFKGDKIGHLSGNAGWVASLNLSKDRRHILTFSVDRTIREWEIRTHAAKIATLGWISRPNVKFSMEGKYYFVRAERESNFIKYPGYESEEINNDNGDIVKEPVNTANDEIMLFFSRDSSLDNLDYYPEPIRSNKRIKNFCYLPDKKSVITGIAAETIKHWDLDGKLIRDYKIPWNKEIISIAISPDKKFLITGAFEGSATVWNSNGVRLYSIKCHSTYVWAIIISPDSKYFITMGDTQAKLWELETGLHIYTYDEIYHPKMAWYAPNGKYVLVKLDEGGVMLRIPMPLNEFLKSNTIEQISAEQKKQYDIK